MNLPKFSMGVGDRFAQQGEAQLAAFAEAKRHGVEIAPVWNKSNREHLIIHSEPASVRAEADAAVKSAGWTGPYFIDADHINLNTVDRFLAVSNFFTIDVADYIGKPADEASLRAFVEAQSKYIGTLKITGIATSIDVSQERVRAIARKYLFAVQEAGRIYRHIEQSKGAVNFVPEVSMDETDAPQTPLELFFILAALAAEQVPVQTIAPKFTGRFNKGVDYVGDIAQFEREFNDDVAVIAHAIREFGLPGNLKLSVHSGSDKFSLYGPIRRALRKHRAGVHLKTAGTTWLEELIGLAEAGGEGLTIAKDVYAQAMLRFDELCGPYATVIDVRQSKLPGVETVRGWTSEQFTAALRHDPAHPQFNPDFRQLLHVGFKVAAAMGTRYLDALKLFQAAVSSNVTRNLYDRHMTPLFLAEDA